MSMKYDYWIDFSFPLISLQINSMKMDQNDDCGSDMSGKDLIPSETYAYGLYGPPRVHSRIGDDYQTEIPPLITNPEYLDYIKNPIEEEMRAGFPSEFLIGLDIPIFWIKQESEIKIEPKFDAKQGDLNSNSNSNSTSDMGIFGNQCLVPGCFLEPWTETEKGSFVLGLYIFEKDFVRLKRFIESKNMGEILAYYYGTFYRSDEYRRWSESRKSRGKRCVMGARIFTTLRQQELLSRLMPNVSQECQNSLLEISRTFGDGKTSVEEYVFSLRSLIGIKPFIDSMAIGKGKQDLTGSTIEPTKQNQAIHIRPEIPVGKACSSLTSTEIIQFLTGDYRLSKARSNDLFWEAVWPRLLANGWHSEQPNGYNYAANGKHHNLVFLFPGVKKFSRRLVKGESYLDSVTDVLNKVGSDPRILELSDEIDIGMELERDEDTNNNNNKNNGFVEKRKSHCYLQPRPPNLGTVLMKFTVVDTSLTGKIVKLTEFEPRDWDSRSHSGNVSELVSDESDSADMFLAEQETGSNPTKKLKTGEERRKSPEVKRKVAVSRKLKPENASGHHKRRRRLTACVKAGSSRETDDLTENVGSSSQANNNNNHNNLSSFSSKCSSIDTVEEHDMSLIDLNVVPEFVNSEFVPEGRKVEENGGRRQSTRNRPPTARALEALANGFLTVNCRKKGKEERSRSFRHSRPEIGVVSESSTGDASSAVKGDDENGEIAK
ncbi:hypothetical protein LXL04_028863 [Taraxacum kok-saghyz]